MTMTPIKKEDDLAASLKRWKRELEKFDSAEPDEAGFAALELEAAKRRFICLLNRRRGASPKY